MPNNRIKISAGDVFGDWTVVNGSEEQSKYGHIKVLCKCVCGVERYVGSSILKNGRSTGCGCSRLARFVTRKTKHGFAKHVLYPVWNTMIQRCYNKKQNCYPKYGGRGIKVCERWHVFENWLADMGDRPEGFSIERKNNNGDYCQENCIWADQKTQCNNRTTSHFIEVDGISKTIQQWAEDYMIKPHTIMARIKRGWPIETAISAPLDPRGSKQ